MSPPPPPPPPYRPEPAPVVRRHRRTPTGRARVYDRSRDSKGARRPPRIFLVLVLVLVLTVVGGIVWRRSSPGANDTAASEPPNVVSTVSAPDSTTVETAPPPPSSSAAPAPPAPPAVGATTMRTALMLDGVEVSSGFVDLRTGNLALNTAAPLVYSGATVLDAVEVRSVNGLVLLSVPPSVASAAVTTRWIELFAALSRARTPTPFAQLLVSNPGARLAVVTAGTTGTEPAHSTEVIRGVDTVHRREVVDFDLAQRRLAGSSAETALVSMRNESVGAPLVVDVWRDAGGVPLRIVVPYPRADGTGYLMADLAEPGVPAAFESPPAADVTWSVAAPIPNPVPAEDSSSF